MVDKHLQVDHSFGMLAVSFQLLTWCTDSAEDFMFFYLSQLMSIEIHNYCSFVFKMSSGQQKSVFLYLKPYKTSLKLLRKKSHNLHYRIIGLSNRTICPEKSHNLHFLIAPHQKACYSVAPESRGHGFKPRRSPEFFTLLYAIVKIALTS